MEKLTPEGIRDIYGILQDCFPYIGKKDRHNEATTKLADLFEAQLAKVLTDLKREGIYNYNNTGKWLVELD